MRAVQNYLQSNPQTFVDNNYLHSYKKNFLTVVKSLSLTPVQTSQILGSFIDKKKNDFENFCNKYNIVEPNSFLKELSKVIKTENNIDEVLENKVNSLFGKDEGDNFLDLIGTDFDRFIEKLKLDDDLANALNLKTQVDKFAVSKTNGAISTTAIDLSKTGFDNLKKAFLKDLKNESPDKYINIKLILDSIGKKHGANEILAAAVGITKLSKQDVAPLQFSSLRSQIMQNLGLEGNEKNRKSGIYNNVKGLFSEVIAEKAFSEIFGSLVSSKGTEKVGTATAKTDLLITLPNNEDYLGVSIKNMVLIDNYSKQFKKPVDIFKVQDLTLNNLGEILSSSKISKIAKSLSVAVNTIYYLIINEQFFASEGSRDKQTGTYKTQTKNKRISDYLDSYFLALAGIWFGDSIKTNIENDKSFLMNNGLVYDPNRQILIPVYKMLETIKKQLLDDNYKNNMKSIKVNYYYNKSNVDPKDLYARKKKNFPPKNSGVYAYPEGIIKEGQKSGQQILQNMKVTVTLLFMDELIQKTKY